MCGLTLPQILDSCTEFYILWPSASRPLSILYLYQGRWSYYQNRYMSIPYPPLALLKWDGWLTAQTTSHGCYCTLCLHASRLGTALFPTKINALDLILVSIWFGERKGCSKNISDYPLSGWACHIAEEVSRTNYNALLIWPDFIRDEDNLSLFCTSVFMWLTSNCWTILVS